jgi:hypothetical protein
MQHHRQLVQRPIAKTFRLDRLYGGENVIAIDADWPWPCRTWRICSASDS